MQKELEKVWVASKRKTNLQLDFENVGRSANYNMHTNVVTIQMQEVERERKNLERKGILISSTELAQFLLVHEIGHSEDDQLSSSFAGLRTLLLNLFEEGLQDTFVYKRCIEQMRDTILAYERKAWDIGEQYLPSYVNRQHFEMYRDMALKTYQDFWEITYQNLLSLRNVFVWHKKQNTKNMFPLNLFLNEDTRQAIFYQQEIGKIAVSLLSLAMMRRNVSKENEQEYIRSVWFSMIREMSEKIYRERHQLQGHQNWSVQQEKEIWAVGHASFITHASTEDQKQYKQHVLQTLKQRK